MDYSIAIIVPSNEVSTTARRAAETLHLDIPVIAASSGEAVEEARKLIPLGLRLIISHGITYQYLKKELSIPLLELPFGGLDVMATVKQALDIGGRIVHIGTRPFYHYICRSLTTLGIDTKRIFFCELNMEQTIDQQVLTMLDYNFDVFIGGYPVVYTARKAGKIGLEFNVSTEIIQTTLKNAHMIVTMMKQQEENRAMDRAILQTTSDGLIVTDPENNILFINPAAVDIFRHPAEELSGQNLDLMLQKYHIADYRNMADSAPGESMVPVMMKKTPIILRQESKGTVISIKKVSEIHDMEYKIRNDLIVKGFVAKHNFSDIIGNSPAILLAKEKAATYARYNSTILIYGETGTGKELFAQSIHNASPRKKQPFIAVNCAALPENLIESELFGYVKGAFTGANSKGKQGLFEQADGGTIFLDEISEIPISIQSKLLRVLQEGDIIRIGGDKVIHVDIRIICSSNKNLLKLIDEGTFKNDLYYRLSTLEINIPPLRQRPEDIGPLTQALLYKYSKKHNKTVYALDPDVLSYLSRMSFPGNVRQLSNIIERMVILSDSDVVNMETLMKCDLPTDTSVPAVSPTPAEVPSVPHRNLHESEETYIRSVLEECGGNKTAAARILGIHPTTLWRKLKKMDII